MNIAGVKAGDIIFVEKKQGWRFLAYVEGRVAGKQELNIKPIHPVASFYSCTSREVKKHYRLMGRAKNDG